MMFIQFFIWGVWYVTMGTYLFRIGFDGFEVGRAYSAIPIGAIISPFIIGLIADRFFAAQKVLAVLHIIGGIFLFWVSSVSSPIFFYWLLLIYAVCYMPTLALVNTICFNRMKEPGIEFPWVRVFGTLGWIIAGIIISLLDWEDSNLTLKLGAAISIFMGLYALTLPNTPPKSVGEKINLKDIVGLDALKLLKDQSFAIFTISSLLISIPLTFYYNFANPFLNEAGMENAALKMTLGQLSEFLFLLFMPFFFARLGIKKMMLIGMLSWAFRYLLFALGNNDELVFMFYLGIILHGVCYDFFFVSGQIYVDNKAPKSIQASAQGFITLVTYGIGMLIGSWFSGAIVNYFTRHDVHQWMSIWSIPAIMAVVVALMFIVFFRDENKS